MASSLEATKAMVESSKIAGDFFKTLYDQGNITKEQWQTVTNINIEGLTNRISQIKR